MLDKTKLSDEMRRKLRSRSYEVRYVSGLPKVRSGKAAVLAVYDGSIFIWREGALGREWGYEIPLELLRSGRIETGERLTAMRIITTGPVGFFWKKKDKYLVLDWDDPSGLNVPVILSFNGANEALARIQQARIDQRGAE